MIGKTDWFIRRKYSGWGLTPVKWQGFAYIGLFAGVIALIQALALDPTVKFGLTVLLVVVILLDVLHIMASIKLDEREAKIEAIAERNASWAMVATIGLMIAYLSIFQVNLPDQLISMLLVIPLGTGVIAKAITNILLQNREL